jgi:cellulose synthase (UDP-forming)
MDFSKIKGETLRRILAVIALLVTIYYLYWRVTETFNPSALIFSWALWGAEVFGFLTTALFYFTVWKPKTRTAPDPITGRTVDVFIPTKDESVSVLRKTLLACRDIKYPHRTLVLDDGNRSEVKALAEELGCVYLAREEHKGAKAGNLNFGLEHSTAEFIAIFDADHAPLPEFIDRLIGYFADDDVAFVQTPQEFYNIDSYQHRVDEKHKYIWAEQYLFFSLIQPGRDHWNAAYFVGSCAMLRRKALDDIEGFPTESITEDMLTSVNLHSKGWNSIYHNENLAYGIAAESIQPFYIQRRRWGVGGWQVWFRANPLFKRGLSFSQRLCYLASMIYPMEGYQKLIFYLTPPIVLFTTVLPMKALDITYLLHFIPYYTISLYAYNEMSRGYGGTLMMEQFSMGKFGTYIATLWAFLLPKKARQFTVTPKGDKATSSDRYLVPQYLVCVFSILGILWALLNLWFHRRSDEFIVAVNSLWALYNSGLAVAIIRYTRSKITQRREEFRIPDWVPVIYRYELQEQSVRRIAVAENITKKGLSLLTIGGLSKGQEFEMDIVLPNKTVTANGTVLHEENVTTGNYIISQSGFLFSEAQTEKQDELSRYLSESAISKFLKEYATRYMTHMERTLEQPEKRHKRADRFLAYMPAVVCNDHEPPSYGVIRNVSESGMLLATRDNLDIGHRVTIETVLGRDLFPLNGVVVRKQPHEALDYPEYLVGVEFYDRKPEYIDRVLKVAEKTEELLESYEEEIPE